MNNKKTEKFIGTVNNDLPAKGFNFEDPKYSYLELYFLEWEILSYISRTNLMNIKKALKGLGEEELCVIIEDSMLERVREPIKEVSCQVIPICMTVECESFCKCSKNLLLETIRNRTRLF